MPDPDITGSDLAHWLQEAGRRRSPSAPMPEPERAAPAETPAAAPKSKRPHILHHRELLLLLVAALAFMPYFFADVHLQIYRLKHLIAFVFPDLN